MPSNEKTQNTTINLKQMAEDHGLDPVSFEAVYEAKLADLKAKKAKDTVINVAGKKVIISVEKMAANQAVASMKGSSKSGNSIEGVPFYLMAQGESVKTTKGTPMRDMYLICEVGKQKDFFYNIPQDNGYAFVKAKFWSSNMFRPGFYTGALKQGTYNGYTTFSIDKLAQSTKKFDLTKSVAINPFKKFKVLSSYKASEVAYKAEKDGHVPGEVVLKSDGTPLRSRGLTVITQGTDQKKQIVSVNTTVDKWLDMDIDLNQTFQGIITNEQYPKLITTPMKAEGDIELNTDIDVPIVSEFTDMRQYEDKYIILYPAVGGAEIALNDKDGRITAFSTVTDIFDNASDFKLSTFNPDLFENIKVAEGDKFVLPGLMKILVRPYVSQKDNSVRGTVYAISVVNPEELGEIAPTVINEATSSKKEPSKGKGFSEEAAAEEKKSVEDDKW
jgi:hypothetical protein